MALSRGMVLFLFSLVVIAELGTIDAKHAKKTIDPTTIEEEGSKGGENEEVEESHCLTKSQQFQGFCFSSDSCADVCKKESFPDGECKRDGTTRKCFCKKFC